MDLRSPRVLWTDAARAAVYVLVCAPFALSDGPVVLLVIAGFTAALILRRYSPAMSLGIAWAAALLQMLLLLDVNLYDVAVLGVLYATSAYGGRALRWVGLASAILGALIATSYLALVKPFFTVSSSPVDPTGLLLTSVVVFIAAVAVLVLAWALGLLVRALRSSRELRRREELALRERELAEYRYIVEQERSRIARDMHDVVAHSLAVVIAQADGARFAATMRPDLAVEALSTISGVARTALGEVRMLLSELRHDESDAPQPLLDDLQGLVEQMRAAGLNVDLTEHGTRGEFTAGHQIAVYRIVQEALTNALRHGDAASPVRLELDWRADGVGIDVQNTAAPAATGGIGHHGIPGMRERANLAGGTFAAGLHADDAATFRVQAWIPDGRAL